MARLSPSAIIDSLSGAINKVQKDGQDTSGADIEWRQLDNGDVVQATKGGKISESENDRLPQQEAWCKCDVEYRQLSDSQKDDLRDRARRIDWEASIYQLFMRDCINEELAPPEIKPDTLALEPSERRVFNPNLADIDSPAVNAGVPLSVSELGSYQLQSIIPLREYEDTPVVAAAGWEIFDTQWVGAGYFVSQYPADQAPDLDPPIYDVEDPENTEKEEGGAYSILYNDPDPSILQSIVSGEPRAEWIDKERGIMIYSTATNSATALIWGDYSISFAAREGIVEADQAGREIADILYEYGYTNERFPQLKINQSWERGSFLAPLSEIRPELNSDLIQETKEDFAPIIYWKSTDDAPNGHAYLYPSGEVIVTGSDRPSDLNEIWYQILSDAGLR